MNKLKVWQKHLLSFQAPPHGILIDTGFIVERPGRNHQNQVTKVNITGNGTNWNRPPFDSTQSEELSPPSVLFQPKMQNLNGIKRKHQTHTEGHSPKPLSVINKSVPIRKANVRWSNLFSLKETKRLDNEMLTQDSERNPSGELWTGLKVAKDPRQFPDLTPVLWLRRSVVCGQHQNSQGWWGFVSPTYSQVVQKVFCATLATPL